jgi:peptidoglycan/LPS O-acetylase OafA/YrhL
MQLWMTEAQGSHRLQTVDALRGLASVAVCWYHLANTSTGWWTVPTKWGYLGVEVFFVISGFIIPYSLYCSGYAPRLFPRFLLKRVIRLDPPYFVTIALILTLTALAARVPGFKGDPWPFTTSQVLLHIGYLNSIAGKPWLNSVFWSLGVEFQWYLFAGAMFALLASPKRGVQLLVALLFLGAGLAPYNQNLLWSSLPMFLIGIAVFHHRFGNISWYRALLVFAAAGAVLAYRDSAAVALASIGAGSAIMFVNIRSRLLNALGAISYSLYLTHAVVYSRVENLAHRVVSTAWDPAICVFGFGVCLVVAFALYKIVELPSRRLSSRIRYATPTQVRAQANVAVAS